MAYPVLIGEQESTGAKAGRFVRAAGHALGTTARELNKNVQASRTDERATAAAAPAVPPPPPPAPARTGGLVGKLAFYGLVVSSIAFLLVVLRVEMVLGKGSVRTVFRFVLSVALFGEAYLLLSNWRGANQRLGQRVLTKVWGPRGAVTRRERVFARVVRDVLTLVGIAWLAAGVFELLSATVGY
jgi:hypothetical protein